MTTTYRWWESIRRLDRDDDKITWRHRDDDKITWRRHRDDEKVTWRQNSLYLLLSLLSTSTWCQSCWVYFKTFSWLCVCLMFSSLAEFTKFKRCWYFNVHSIYTSFSHFNVEYIRYIVKETMSFQHFHFSVKRNSTFLVNLLTSGVRSTVYSALFIDGVRCLLLFSSHARLYVSCAL